MILINRYTLSIKKDTSKQQKSFKINKTKLKKL